MEKKLDLQLCIICQRQDEEKTIVQKPQLETLRKRIDEISRRAANNEDYYVKLQAKVSKYTLSQLYHGKATYHRECAKKVSKQQYVKKSVKIKRSFGASTLGAKVIKLESSLECSDSPQSSATITRSQVDVFDRNLCFFCQSNEDISDLHEISSFARNFKLRKAVEDLGLQHLFIRYNSAIDARAGDFKYHTDCWTRYVDRNNYQVEEVSPVNQEDLLKLCVQHEVLHRVENSLNCGEILNIRDIVEDYDAALEQNGIEDCRSYSTKRKFWKEKIFAEISRAEFQRRDIQNKPECIYLDIHKGKILENAFKNLEAETNGSKMSRLWSAAKELRNEALLYLKSTEVEFKGSVKSENGSLPAYLTSFIRWILVGTSTIKGERSNYIDAIVNSLTSYLLYNIKTKRQAEYTPKDDSKVAYRHQNENLHVIGMGLASRQCGRSQINVNLLHGYGLSISSTRCLEIETSLANSVIQNINANGGIFVPRDLVKNKFMFHLDNADFREDSKETTHVLLLVGFQKKIKGAEECDVNIDLKLKKLQLEENTLGELLPFEKPPTKTFLLNDAHKNFKVLQNQHIASEMFESTTRVWELAKSVEEILKRNINMLDLSCTAFPSCVNEYDVLAIEIEGDGSDTPCPNATEDMPDMQSIPTWSGYNSLLSTGSTKSLTNTLYFPLIPAPASNFSAVYTALKNAQMVTEFANGSSSMTVLTLDLDLYERALQVVQSNEELRRRFILRLGTLHIVFADLRAIGHFITGSGIDTAWETADLLGSGKVFSVLTCGQGAMSTAVATHEVTLVALYAVLYESLLRRNPSLLLGECSDITQMLCGASHDPEIIKANHERLRVFSQSGLFKLCFENLQREISESPQHSWISIYMNMVERLLTLIQSTRQGNWLLHLAALEDICKDICSMDRIKYRRLLPVYIADMYGLQTTAPHIWEEFMKGNFVVQKSNIDFTAIGVDHAGEQVNKILKSPGGLIGISKNENARNRFFLTIPFIAKITQDMKEAADITNKTRQKHYQLSSSLERTRSHQISSLRDVFKNNGIDFLGNSPNIHYETDIPTVEVNGNIVKRPKSFPCNETNTKTKERIHNIITKAEVSEETEKDILSIEKVGQTMHYEYCEERLGKNATASIWEPIKRRSLKVFATTSKEKSKERKELGSIKEHRALFARCALLAQSGRGINMEEAISSYELGLPRSLVTLSGELHPGHEGKSALMHAIRDMMKIDDAETLFNNLVLTETEEVCKEIILGDDESMTTAPKNVAIIDAMVVVQKLTPKPVWVETCADLARYFLEKVDKIAQSYNEVKLIFDRYEKDSLKSNTRKYRRHGEVPVKYKVEDTTNIKKVALSKFLSHEETKQDLTCYLGSKAISHFAANAQTYTVIFDGKTFSSVPQNQETINHEEADTIIVRESVKLNMYNINRIDVFSPDTDVLVLLIGHSNKIKPRIHMVLSATNTIDVKMAYKMLGSNKSRALIGLHALTGCDTTGKTFKKGKQSWWGVFETAEDDVIQSLQNLVEEVMLESTWVGLEKLFAKVYCPGRKITTLNRARWHLFCKNNADCEKLPPTHGAFVQHVKRAHLQGMIWGAADNAIVPRENPILFGWTADGGVYKPVTSMEPIAPKEVLNTIKCTCEGNCDTKRCGCVKGGIACCHSCTCSDYCENTDIVTVALKETESIF